MSAHACIAYHDASADYHQSQFDAPDGLVRKGFRIRSLSIYRNPSAVLYAAVWTNEGGPGWLAFHGLASQQYQEYFDLNTAQGFRPVIITATGGGIVGADQANESRFAGVFEQDATPFFARHDIGSIDFRNTCEQAKQDHFALRCATIYGGQERLYAGIWERVGPDVDWDYKIMTAIDGPGPGLPMTHPGNSALRLAFITRSPFGECLGIYRSDQSAELAERHGLTSGEYQAQFNALTADGFMPRCVQAGGDPRVSDTPRFVALFEKPRIVLSKDAIKSTGMLERIGHR